MGKLSLSIALVGAAACGGNNNTPVDAHIVVPDSAPDAKVWMDAPPPMFDLSCLGNAAPTTAAAMVSLSGTVQEGSINGVAGLPGATVDACTGNCLGANKLDTKTTDATGAFTLGPVPTGGTPLNGYLKMTKTGDRTTFSYGHAPIVANSTGVPILTFQPLVITLLAQAGCTQDDTTKGMVAIIVNDCAGTRITDSANLSLSIKQGTTSVGDQPIDLGALSAMAAGLYLVCNVPEGTTTVGATYSTHVLLAHDVSITKATTTETDVRPGY